MANNLTCLLISLKGPSNCTMPTVTAIIYMIQACKNYFYEVLLMTKKYVYKNSVRPCKNLYTVEENKLLLEDVKCVCLIWL